MGREGTLPDLPRITNGSEHTLPVHGVAIGGGLQSRGASHTLRFCRSPKPRIVGGVTCHEQFNRLFENRSKVHLAPSASTYARKPAGRNRHAWARERQWCFLTALVAFPSCNPKAVSISQTNPSFTPWSSYISVHSYLYLRLYTKVPAAGHYPGRSKTGGASCFRGLARSRHLCV